jgi:hypothetical protein
MGKVLLFVAMAAQLAAQANYSLLGEVRPAPQLNYPSSVVDGNSPGLWVDGKLKVYTSTGDLLKMSGDDLHSLQMDAPPLINSSEHQPMWIESVWRDPQTGTVYGWYHNEPGGYCPGKGLTMPRIGALVSHDGGETFEDLGIVLSAGEAPNCNAKNGFFAGGHGDFSVILDRKGEYFYFLFDNYGGAANTQGIAMARLAFDDRDHPVGNVYKYYEGDWQETGIGGRLTPVITVRVPWESANTDAHWGPSVSWNTYIQRYVILLNRSCCEPEWPQEGIYISYSSDISDPDTWTRPVRILTPNDIGFAPGFYPQLVGTGPGESDSLTGQASRIFVKGISKWELVFPEGIDPANIPDPDPENPEDPDSPNQKPEPEDPGEPPVPPPDA